MLRLPLLVLALLAATGTLDAPALAAPHPAHASHAASGKSAAAGQAKSTHATGKRAKTRHTRHKRGGRHGYRPNSCGTHRSKALFRDTVASYARHHRLSVRTFLALNGMQGTSPNAKLVHRHRYVTSRGGVGERLYGGVSMGASTGNYVVSNPNRAWGQPFVVDLLQRAARTVQERYPQGHRLVFEDLSFPKGGCMSPHIEHRGGLEVDVGFYHHGIDPGKRLKSGTNGTLDGRRTLLFLRTLLETGQVDRIITDRRVLSQLRSQARRQGVAAPTIAKWFSAGGRRTRAIANHGSGHGNHFHVRFKCPATGCQDRIEVLNLPDDPTPIDDPAPEDGATPNHTPVDESSGDDGPPNEGQNH
jgi:hypothetical protein